MKILFLVMCVLIVNGLPVAISVLAFFDRPAKNPDVVCFEEEVLVQVGERSFLVPKGKGFRRKEYIKINDGHNYNRCRYKWEKIIPVKDIRFTNHNEYTDERKDMIQYRYDTQRQNRKDKKSEASNSSERFVMPQMAFQVRWLDQPYEEPYEKGTLEEMLQHYIQPNVRGYHRQLKKLETPPITELDKKLRKGIIKRLNDPQMVAVMDRWQDENFSLESLPKKQGFFELENVPRINNRYFGYLPTMKLPVQLACSDTSGICGCSVMLTPRLRFNSAPSATHPGRTKYYRDLNVYVEECEMGIKDAMLMEHRAQQLMNELKNEGDNNGV